MRAKRDLYFFHASAITGFETHAVLSAFPWVTFSQRCKNSEWDRRDQPRARAPFERRFKSYPPEISENPIFPYPFSLQHETSSLHATFGIDFQAVLGFGARREKLLSNSLVFPQEGLKLTNCPLFLNPIVRGLEGKFLKEIRLCHRIPLSLN